MSLIPTSPQAPGEWPSPEELGARAAFTTPDHAPLSPQSSVASSGSEQTEEQGSSRNTFQEDGSGMKGASEDSARNPSLGLGLDQKDRKLPVAATSGRGQV